MKIPLALACVAGLALIPSVQRSEKDLTPRERERLMAAIERAAIRERAALDAEAVAGDLRATADEMERLSAQAEAAAAAAEKGMRGSRRPKVVLPVKPSPPAEAPERTKGKTQDGTAPGRPSKGLPEAVSPAEKGPGDEPPSVAPRQGNGGRLANRPIPLQTLTIDEARGLVGPIHAAAARSSKENKATYLPKKRATRVRSDQRTRGTGYTFEAGKAPDIGDVDFYAEWQWCLNVARGGGKFRGAKAGTIAKTGHVDLARLTIQPDKSTMAKDEMKWGMRRYNLGDVTVVDCDFTDIVKEHGIYDNLAGHGLYRGNTFKNLGGQAIQLAYREYPYAQYWADNMPFTAPPLILLEDNHAVDCGQNAGRSGFAWTFFDPGTFENPGRVVVRGCTFVNEWDFTRTAGGQMVGAEHPNAIRSPGGLVLNHYTPRPKDIPMSAPRYATEVFVMDACLFDIAQGSNPVVAVRGVGTILIEDSCFIARRHKDPGFHVDDAPGQPSGKIVIENCVSPKEHEVWLMVRGKRVRSMHCPGKRIEIDVKTLAITEGPMEDDPISRVISPLSDRTVRPGVHPQEPGHKDEIGALDFESLK